MQYQKQDFNNIISYDLIFNLNPRHVRSDNWMLLRCVSIVDAASCKIS